MKLILIGGQAGSGKNTVAEMIKENLESEGKTVAVFGNADSVREYANKYFNLDNYKTDEGRRIMIGITDMMYDLYPNYYEKRTMDKLAKIQSELKTRIDVAIVSDWRYPCTYEYFIKNPFIEVKTLYVKREDFNNNYADDIKNDKSEREETLKRYIQSYVYNNSTLENLDKAVALYCLNKLL